MFKKICFIILGMLVILPTSIWAQDSKAKTQTKESKLKEDLSRFWAKSRKVKVVQKRLFMKDRRLEVMTSFGVIPNDSFQMYTVPSLRVGYHFAESFMVELSYGHALRSDSGLVEYLKESESIVIKDAEIREYVRSMFTVNILWSPIYGKLSLLGKKLTHFDTYMGVGGGILFTTGREQDDNPDPQDFNRPALDTVLGVRWHITDMFNIRTEYRHYFHQKATGGISMPLEINLGLGLTFL
jgi:outer membrane beta-barrel protein